VNKKDNLFIGLDIGTTKICAIIGEKLAMTASKSSALARRLATACARAW
jgi:cell division ATPase FtsA